MRSPWIKVVAIVVGLVLVAAIAISFLVNGETFRPTVQGRLSSALNRKVTLGHLSFSLFSGSLVASDVAISDDPAFSAVPFIKAKELRVGVEVSPLLFHHEVHITSLTIDSPSIQLIQNQAGKWNYSTIGGNTKRTSQQESTGIPDLTVARLQIKDGSASLSSVPPTARPVVYSNVNLTVKNFAFSSNFPFDLSASLPANGSLKLNGTAGPIAQKDAADTPFRASIQIAHLDAVAAGLVEANKGISGVIDATAQVNSDGNALTSSGKVKVANLLLSRAGSPTPQPVDIDYNIANDLDARTGRVNDIALHSGAATAHVTGTYKFTPAAVLLNLHVSAPSLPVDQLETLLPAVGVKVPAGSQLKGGTLTANLAVSGPATATTIAGPVEIDNSRLAGFDLGSKIQGLSTLSKGAGGTDIQKLSATVNSSPQTTQISNIDCIVPQIGTATGGGTVSPSGALDFKLTATLNNNNIVGAAANQAINQVTNAIGGFLHPNTKPTTNNTPRGIPLTVTGTTTNPTIRANVGAMLR